MYDIRICQCGRIHMVTNEKINNALQENKDLLLICAGCGKAILIGADAETDLNKTYYMMYSYECSEGEINPNNLYTIIYSYGKE